METLRNVTTSAAEAKEHIDNFKGALEYDMLQVKEKLVGVEIEHIKFVYPGVGSFQMITRTSASLDKEILTQELLKRGMQAGDIAEVIKAATKIGKTTTSGTFKMDKKGGDTDE
jgi:hypothetical protein